MRTLIFLLLISSNAFSYDISDQSKKKILMGFECCYNDSIIEEAKLEALQFNPPKEYQFNFKIEDRLIDPYKIFIALQILDVLTTYEGMKYSCVKEVNPLLPEKPSIGRVIGHKTSLLWWTPYFVSSATLTREEKDWVWKPGNYLMAAVVLNNIQVLNRVRNNELCPKL